ncbi:MAG: hypothetical protein HYS63_06115 [Methylocystis sp.]|nr:hypothetical protein [Methylocystis sp.]
MGLLTYQEYKDSASPSPTGLATGAAASRPGTDIEFVYVVAHQAKEAPTFLASPSLVFKAARLQNPDMPLVSDASAVRREDFIDGAVSLSEKQSKAVEKLASGLVRECAPLRLLVRGFASYQPIQDGDHGERKDSEALNLAEANFRGEAVKNALKDSVAKNFADRADAVSIEAVHWSSHNQMVHARDSEVFRNVEIGLSPEIDHRSAVIVVEKPGDCPKIVSPPPAPSKVGSSD